MASRGAGVTAERVGDAKLAAPRHLTDAQQKAFGGSVAGYPGVTFEVVTYGGDPEADALAKRISGSLQSAGLHLEIIDESLLSAGPGVKPRDKETNSARSLVDALIAANIPTPAVESGGMMDSPAKVKVVVGRKP